MITTNTGAKKLEASDNWREIFPNPDLSTAGAHNASVDAADRIQPEIAPIINGKQCALGAASGDYVLLRNSTITGKSDGAYIATKAIPANTDIDSTYLGNAITGGMVNSLNSNLTTKIIIEEIEVSNAVTLTSGSYQDFYNIPTKQGYTAIGVAGFRFSGSGSTNLAMLRNYAFAASNGVRIYCGIRNIGEIDVSNCVAYSSVIWMKDV